MAKKRPQSSATPTKRAATARSAAAGVAEIVLPKAAVPAESAGLATTAAASGGTALGKVALAADPAVLHQAVAKAVAVLAKARVAGDLSATGRAGIVAVTGIVFPTGPSASRCRWM